MHLLVYPFLLRRLGFSNESSISYPNYPHLNMFLTVLDCSWKSPYLIRFCTHISRDSFCILNRRDLGNLHGFQSLLSSLLKYPFDFRNPRNCFCISLPDLTVSMFLIIAVLVVVFVVYKSFTSVLPHYFVVPHQNWRERIAKVIKHDKPIYLNVGYKRSSYRRRLILASIQPSFYTNFRNNKIKLQPEDAAKDNQRFLTEMRRRGVDDPSRKLLYLSLIHI